VGGSFSIWNVVSGGRVDWVFEILEGGVVVLRDSEDEESEWAGG
jgi:hypothetical protein